MGAREVVAELIAAYPSARIPAETARLYMRKLADVPPGVLDEVAHEVICTSERFPSIAALRRAAAERLLALPSEAEALALIEARAARRTQDAPNAPALHPDLAATLRLVGGLSALRTADNPAVWRGQFLKLWRERREDLVRQAQVGVTADAVRPLPAVACSQ